MKFSARLATVSFVALAAMGTATLVFGGCTVTSGTVDNSDSGTNKSDSGAADSAADSATDSATDSGPGACADNTKQTNRPIVSNDCQTCLDTSCCSELKGCFGLAVDTDGGTLECNAFSTCYSDCYTKPSQDQNVCFQDCDDSAGTGVAAAYNKILDCAEKNCATACKLASQDAGDGG